MGVVISETSYVGRSGNTNAFVLATGLSGADYGKGYEYASQGSCIIVPPGQGAIQNVFQTPLDAGSIQLAGPSGQTNLQGGPGIYQAQLLPNSPALPPGTYTFTGAGGKDIGAFKTVLNVQTPLAITNTGTLATITRSQGATVTWTGGYAGGDVQVEAGIGGPFGTARFYCHAPTSAGQLTIPASILLAMPQGSGSFNVTNSAVPQTVSASGVDAGLAFVTTVFNMDVTLK